MIFVRAGECAFDMTEELAFHQFARHCRAIDAEHGSIGSRAGFVYGARNEFLADAAFATNQDAAGCLGNSRDTLLEL